MRSRSRPAGPERMLLPILIDHAAHARQQRALACELVSHGRSRRLGASAACGWRAARTRRADLAHQLGDAGAGGGRDAPQLDAARGEALAQSRRAPSARRGVDLVGDDDLRLGGDGGIEQRQLAVDDVEVVERVAAAHAAGVEQMHQQAGARDVAQEAVAEAVAGVGALDQAGDVGEDEGGVLVDAHHAEVRHQRGERVVGDARARGRDAADERRLADVRKAEQADVGDQVQLERAAGAPRPSSPGCDLRGAWLVDVL